MPQDHLGRQRALYKPRQGRSHRAPFELHELAVELVREGSVAAKERLLYLGDPPLAVS